jgi:hypothetical protein
MDSTSIAPCGVNCDLCLGFQREQNKCVGCNHSGNKPYHCTVCSIKTCQYKNGKENELCCTCVKYPCRRIKDLNKRYKSKYGESILENFESITRVGIDAFIINEKSKWKCPTCGNVLCVHRDKCLICNTINPLYPKEA